jgi:uncharacterized membrane protein SpoIIM required for sporulation
VFAAKGLGVGFAGWLMIHGTTELFAIIAIGRRGLSHRHGDRLSGPLVARR